MLLFFFSTMTIERFNSLCAFETLLRTRLGSQLFVEVFCCTHIFHVVLRKLNIGASENTHSICYQELFHHCVCVA